MQGSVSVKEGVAYPPNKILKVVLKTQAFYVHFIKFCLALNGNISNLPFWVVSYIIEVCVKAESRA